MAGLRFGHPELARRVRRRLNEIILADRRAGKIRAERVGYGDRRRNEVDPRATAKEKAKIFLEDFYKEVKPSPCKKQ